MAITIDATPFVSGTIPTKSIGATVTLGTNTSPAPLTHAWSLLDVPKDSATVLSSDSAPSPTITLDRSGTYLIKLIEDGNPVFAAVQVQSARQTLRPPAHTEGSTDSGGDLAGSRGWTPTIESLYRQVSFQLGRNVLVGYNGTGSSVDRGDVVALTSMTSVGSGTAEEDDIPSFISAQADSAPARKIVGLVMGDLEGNGTIANGALMVVMLEGIFTDIDTTSFSDDRDPVYLSDTPKAISTTVGTAERLIGKLWGVPSATGSIELRKVWHGEYTFEAVGTTSALEVDQCFLPGSERLRLIDAYSGDGAITLTLPEAGVEEDGKQFTIQRRGANTVTVEPASGYSIYRNPGGATDTSLATDGDSVTYVYEHANTRFRII